MTARAEADIPYDVNVYREGEWWMIEVPAIDGLTQAVNNGEVQAQAISLIATTLDVDPAAVEISASYR